MMTITRFYPGQRVTATNGTRYPGNGTVVKHMQKNVRVRLDSGQEVRYDPYFLVPEGEAPALPTASTFKLAEPVGTIVRVEESFVARNPQLSGLWVVVGDQNDKTRIAKIGGDAGRYWRIPNQHIVKYEGVPARVTGFVGN